MEASDGKGGGENSAAVDHNLRTGEGGRDGFTVSIQRKRVRYRETDRPGEKEEQRQAKR